MKKPIFDNNETRERIVTFTASKSEKEAYLLAAKKEERTLSSFVRHALNKYISEMEV